jgi:hypothetical protein
VKLKDNVLNLKGGHELLVLCGFNLTKEVVDEKTEKCYAVGSKTSVSFLKGVRLDLQGAFSEFEAERAAKKKS